MHIDFAPFCQTEIEDADHLFLHCNITQNIWSLAFSHNWLNINLPFNPQSDALQMLSNARFVTPSIKMDRVVALLWSRRKARKSLVFCNETSNPDKSQKT